MPANYVEVTAWAIFYYNQDTSELDDHKTASEKIKELLLDTDTEFKIMEDGSRILTTKTTITRVSLDVETKKLISNVTDKNTKTIRRYVDDIPGSLDGLPAVEWGSGDKRWCIDGKPGRENGLPAIELKDGSKYWYIDGKLGREGGLPAVERSDGTKEWYINGAPARDGGLPSIEYPDGIAVWYINANSTCVRNKNGMLTWYLGDRIGRSDSNLPSVILPTGEGEWYIDGTKSPPPKGIVVAVGGGYECHYLDGKLHSLDGEPAVVNLFGDKYWYKSGLLHNVYGPAKITAAGKKSYYINGVRTSKETFELVHQTKKSINPNTDHNERAGALSKPKL